MAKMVVIDDTDKRQQGDGDSERVNPERNDKKARLSDVISPDNQVFRFILTWLAIIGTLVVATVATNKFTGDEVHKETWYFLILGASAIIYTVYWLQGKTQLDILVKIGKIILVVGISMVFVNVFFPEANLKVLKRHWNRPDIAKNVTDAPSPKNNLTRDYVVYGPGTYIFSLKEGEMTDKWIVLQPGKKLKYDVSSNDNMFQVYFGENEMYKSWKNEQIGSKSDVRFKLAAVTEQSEIKMVVWE